MILLRSYKAWMAKTDHAEYEWLYLYTIGSYNPSRVRGHCKGGRNLTYVWNQKMITTQYERK